MRALISATPAHKRMAGIQCAVINVDWALTRLVCAML